MYIFINKKERRTFRNFQGVCGLNVVAGLAGSGKTFFLDEVSKKINCDVAVAERLVITKNDGSKEYVNDAVTRDELESDIRQKIKSEKLIPGFSHYGVDSLSGLLHEEKAKLAKEALDIEIFDYFHVLDAKMNALGIMVHGIYNPYEDTMVSTIIKRAESRICMVTILQDWKIHAYHPFARKWTTPLTYKEYFKLINKKFNEEDYTIKRSQVETDIIKGSLGKEMRSPKVFDFK